MDSSDSANVIISMNVESDIKPRIAGFMSSPTKYIHNDNLK
jgi:hypothetical protein